jgi:hypothetical protein
MSIDVEYAIKKDIRNNPLVREVDAAQRSEFRRVVLLATLAVALVLFSMWQRQRMVSFGYEIEALRQQQLYEEVVNRQLRLNFETLRAPQPLEERAARIGMQAPTAADTIVLERGRTVTPSRAIVASIR